jgi:hypothetical protein
MTQKHLHLNLSVELNNRGFEVANIDNAVLRLKYNSGDGIVWESYRYRMPSNFD